MFLFSSRSGGSGSGSNAFDQCDSTGFAMGFGIAVSSSNTFNVHAVKGSLKVLVGSGFGILCLFGDLNGFESVWVKHSFLGFVCIFVWLLVIVVIVGFVGIIVDVDVGIRWMVESTRQSTSASILQKEQADWSIRTIRCWSGSWSCSWNSIGCSFSSSCPSARSSSPISSTRTTSSATTICVSASSSAPSAVSVHMAIVVIIIVVVVVVIGIGIDILCSL